ncbi:cobalt-precorrin-6A reductase [Kytococcus sp. Marseille-QA3725]
MRVLLLGGTAEARELAARLVDEGVDVTSSLAGRVSRPRLPVGDVRVGGFGGVEGLTAALRDGGYTHLVDATHPFAVGVRANAVRAAAEAGVPVVRLARPGWGGHPLAGDWSWVADWQEAADVAAGLGERPFLTSGRQTLAHFGHWADREVLVRVVEPPAAGEVPTGWTVVLDRGPFDVAAEERLMREHGIDVLVTKDSGGSYTSAKLEAAHRLGVPVVVRARPPAPAGMEELSRVEDVLARLRPDAG